MSRVEELLARLEGVKQTGQGRWLAKCPAHEDKRASMSVKELGDGRILIHCFAMCDTENILTGVGLTFSDLFPERLPGIGLPRVHSAKFTPRELLEILGHEITVAALILSDAADKRSINDETWERFAQAASRIQLAREHGR